MTVKEKITCPNCHLAFDKDNEKCPFCGEIISKEEKEAVEEVVTKSEASKKGLKFRKHTWFYLIGFFVEILCFGLMFLPGETLIFRSIYFWAFSSTSSNINGETFIIGTNAATICFIFVVVGALNSVAIFRSLQKKTTEIPLFSYFTAFYFVVIAVVSFLAPVLMSHNAGGDRPTQFTMGIGFILLGVFSLIAAAMNVLGVINYKKFLVSNPLETFKSK